MSDYNDLCAAARKPIPLNTKPMKKAIVRMSESIPLDRRRTIEADIERILAKKREMEAREEISLESN